MQQNPEIPAVMANSLNPIHRSMTRLSQEHCRLEVAVNDWSHTIASLPVGADVSGSVFQSVDTSLWKLSVYPTGKSAEAQGAVSVVLQYLSGPGCIASVAFSIVCQVDPSPHNAKNIRYSSTEAVHFSCVGDEAKAVSVLNLISLQEVAGTTDILCNDTVVFCAQIAIYGQPAQCPRVCPFPLHDEISNPCISNSLSSDVCRLLVETTAPQGNSLSAPNDNLYSDIVIVCGSCRFLCHRAILAVRSAFLQRKFKSRYFGVKVFFHQGEYQIDGCDPAVFRHILKYIYTDCISEECLWEHGAHILEASIKFEIPGLVCLCEEFLIETLTPAKAATLYIMAESAGAFRLSYSCVAVMALHMDEVINSAGFQCLDAATCRRLLHLSTLPRDCVVEAVRQQGIAQRAACAPEAITAVGAATSTPAESAKSCGCDCQPCTCTDPCTCNPSKSLEVQCSDVIGVLSEPTTMKAKHLNAAGPGDLHESDKTSTLVVDRGACKNSLRKPIFVVESIANGTLK